MQHRITDNHRPETDKALWQTAAVESKGAQSRERTSSKSFHGSAPITDARLTCHRASSPVRAHRATARDTVPSATCEVAETVLMGIDVIVSPTLARLPAVQVSRQNTGAAIAITHATFQGAADTESERWTSVLTTRAPSLNVS